MLALLAGCLREAACTAASPCWARPAVPACSQRPPCRPLTPALRPPLGPPQPWCRPGVVSYHRFDGPIILPYGAASVMNRWAQVYDAMTTDVR